MKKYVSVVVALAVSSVFSLASFAEEKAEGPCKQVKEACEKAGFIKNDAKNGDGLWVDCIDPIMTGSAQPKKATKPLPTVDAGLVAACKAKHPNFGVPKAKKTASAT